MVFEVVFAYIPLTYHITDIGSPPKKSTPIVPGKTTVTVKVRAKTPQDSAGFSNKSEPTMDFQGTFVSFQGSIWQ